MCESYRDMLSRNLYKYTQFVYQFCFLCFFICSFNLDLQRELTLWQRWGWGWGRGEGGIPYTPMSFMLYWIIWKFRQVAWSSNLNFFTLSFNSSRGPLTFQQVLERDPDHWECAFDWLWHLESHMLQVTKSFRFLVLVQVVITWSGFTIAMSTVQLLFLNKTTCLTSWIRLLY